MGTRKFSDEVYIIFEAWMNYFSQHRYLLHLTLINDLRVMLMYRKKNRMGGTLTRLEDQKIEIMIAYFHIFISKRKRIIQNII